MRTISTVGSSSSGEHCRDGNFLILAGELAVSIGTIRIRLRSGELLAGHHDITLPHGNEAVLLEVDGPSGIEDYFNTIGGSLLSSQTEAPSFPAQTLAKMIAISQFAEPPKEAPRRRVGRPEQI